MKNKNMYTKNLAKFYNQGEMMFKKKQEKFTH